MAKKRIIDGGSIDYYEHYYLNKYFNLFVDSYDWKNLTYREIKFIMRKFWNNGKIAAFKFRNVEKLGFADWAVNEWDLYGLPEKITLLNERGSKLIPSKALIVDKDCVIGYIQANEKPIFDVVRYYIKRIANVECVLNTNLQLQKMPFIIPVEKEDKNKVLDLIDRILNNEIAVTVEDVDPAVFKAVVTNAPYLIDKLYNYKASLENELKTILGINNNGKEKEEQLQMAEINANNDEINSHADGYIYHLKDWCKRINEVLGIKIDVESKRPKAINDGQNHDGDKPGQKGKEDEDNEI